MVGYLQLPDGKKIDVADGLVLGRTSSCAVVVRDIKASRRHAQMIVTGPVVEIEDLNSSNGTLLNDKPVKRRMLRDGDVVQIGTTRITYHERPPAGAEQPAAIPDQPAPGEDLFAHEDEAADGPVKEPVDVLEFADDEVVQVRRTPTPPRADQPRAAAAARQISRLSMARTVVIPKRDRGLAFGGKSGMLIGDDLRQMSTTMRLLGIVAALAVAGALGYLAYSLVS